MNETAAAQSLPVRLVLSDVDGTLLTEQKELTPRTIEAVARLGEAGILFAVTSSRPPRGMSMINDALHLTTPLAGFNGGVVAKPDYSFLAGHLLAAADARAVVESIRTHGLDAWLYTESAWYVADLVSPHVAREQAVVGLKPVVAADFSKHLAQAAKIVGVSDDPDLIARCEAELRSWGEDRISARRSQSYYLDVTHPQANKGSVVEMLAAMYGISTAQIATIGDGPNDVLMFARSGLSIAMGSAIPAVQAAATQVTASSDDEGFARAMEQFVLPFNRRS